MNPRFQASRLISLPKILLFSWKTIDRKFTRSKFRPQKIKLSSSKASVTAKTLLGKRFITIYVTTSVFKRSESKPYRMRLHPLRMVFWPMLIKTAKIASKSFNTLSSHSLKTIIIRLLLKF